MFIAVGTPARRGDGHADLTFVFDAVRELAKVIEARRPWSSPNRPCRSAPATRSSEILREEGARRTCRSPPTPNSCAKARRSRDFKHPDRIVVGAEDERAREVLREIYRPLFLNQAPILFTGRRTAELTKYAANAFLAIKISFINEIADLCEAVDADVQDVARGIGLDNRIGAKFLHAGPGLWRQLLSQGHAGAAADRRAGGRRAADRRARRSRSTTTARRRWPTGSRRRSAASVSGKRIGVLGLAFKPNTDDMREAPSIPLIKRR